MKYKIRFAYGLLVLLIFSALVREQAHNFRGAADPSAMPPDFPVYYVAGMMAGNGAELYNVPEGDAALRPYFLLHKVPPSSDFGRLAQRAGFRAVYPFIYPPFAALAFRPLTWFSPRLSLFLWRCFGGLLTALSVYFIVATFARDTIWPSYVLALAGAFAFFPFVETINLGQANAVILACWAMGIYLAVNQKFSLSALFFAIGTLIKLSPVLAVGVFVVRRQWKWVFAYLAWLLVLGAVSIGFCGWRPHLTYVRDVLPALGCGIPTMENKSLAGVIESLAIGDVVVVESGAFQAVPLSPAACLVAKALGAILYLGMLFFFHRCRNDQSAIGAELVAIALLTLLVSPLSWRHHYLLALIPMIYLWLPDTASLDRWRVIALAVATAVIGTPFNDYAILYLHGIPRLLANAVEPLAMAMVLGLGMPWAATSAANNHLSPETKDRIVLVPAD